MSSSKRYKRYFIILENEDSGFENKPKKTPKGYAKIEVRNGKGTINVYVQDLKYYENGEYIYRNYLISTKGENACVDTGTVMIDEKGKGELKNQLNPDNVDGEGKTIEDFNVVAIVAEPINKDNDNRNVLSPLVGYINKEKVDWKSVLISGETVKATENDDLDEEDKEKYEKIMEAIKKTSEDLYIGPEEEDEEIEENEGIEKSQDLVEVIENEDKNKEVKPKNKKEDTSENMDSNKHYDVEIEREEEKEEVEEEENSKEEDVNLEIENTNKENTKHYREIDYNKDPVKDRIYGNHPKYKPYHQVVYKYVKDMLKEYEEIEPFERNLNRCKWWKIDYNSQSMYRGFLPFFGYILNTYYYSPYMCYMGNCNDLMYKYGHYIFGVCYDRDKEVKYYVYGVPGRYLYKEQPFRGMTGFVYWHPLEDKKPEKGDYGYWLHFVDAKTGNVVFPMKPTITPMY